MTSITIVSVIWLLKPASTKCFGPFLSFYAYLARIISRVPGTYHDGNLTCPEFQKQATRENLLFSTPLPPVPTVIRDALIEQHYIQGPLKSRVKADKVNDDCLIRIYLGRKREMRTSGAPRQLWLALRTFKMDLQRLIDLEIDTATFARLVAFLLAVMH
jgi:hypothetical protein